MTVRAMAVGDGSAGTVTAQPVGVNTHARARETQRIVAKSDRRREPKTHPIRRLARVAYLDAADSWIAQERSPSAKTVFRTDYTAHLDTVWKPYRLWAVAYRPAAAGFALLLDAIKLLLIHPLRGPLATGAAALIYLIATH